jgi:hypothetical protein
MLVKPMADAWGRFSGYVRLQLHAGRYLAADCCTGECEGQDLALPSAFSLHSCGSRPMQDTRQFRIKATRQNFTTSTLSI